MPAHLHTQPPPQSGKAFWIVWQVFAISFFAIPLTRLTVNASRNNQIKARNARRKKFLKLMKKSPKWLKRKIELSRALASRTTISQKDVFYTTDKQLADQTHIEESLWDEKFEKKYGSRKSTS